MEEPKWFSVVSALAQGDQIGRIFAYYWAIVYFVQFFLTKLQK
jgi:hypothetical protein